MTVELERLGWEIEELTRLYKHLDQSQLDSCVYPAWTAVDVLRHLVWWHESFAAIVQAAADGHEGEVPRGSLTEVNERSVSQLKKLSVRSLVRRLRAAQRVIEGCRFLPTDQTLGYRQGSRRYPFGERVTISVGEMNTHRHDVLRALLAT